jgi:O-antigen biosynthesis protein
MQTQQAGVTYICVVMAVFRPNPEHLREQLQSLAAQSYRPDLVVMVIADCESGDLCRDLAHAIDLPVKLVESGSPMNAVRAFEAGLFAAREVVPADGLIALSDQDDIWHSNRIEAGVKALQHSPAQLLHSDARLVDAAGAELHPSMAKFEKRRAEPGLRGLLYRNTVTGMTVLMKRRLLDVALPFPPQSGVHFYHDLWLALVAEGTGGVIRLPEALVDYRQHGGNTIGAVVNQKASALRGMVDLLRSGTKRQAWIRRAAASYGLARYLAQSTNGRIGEAVMRGLVAGNETRLSPLRCYLRRQFGTGRHLVDAVWLLVSGHPDLARIALNFAVVTLGRDVWIVKHALGTGRTQAVIRLDEKLYSLSPGPVPQSPPQSPADGAPAAQKFEHLVDVRKTPKWVPVMTAPTPALTILIPTLNPTEIFAGIATAIDIGVKLAEQGHHIRFIATDLPIASEDASRQFVLQRVEGDEAARARISLHCGVLTSEIPAHREDLFLATAWWSAHVADTLITRYGFQNRKFNYLIQDFEPNFYAWGPEFADAMASYDLDFVPLFNTTYLRDYFAQQGFAFAQGDALTFRPSIDVSRYSVGERQSAQADAPRRIAVYGRPEVPRNMFATSVEVLAALIEREGLGPKDVEVVSVGLKHAPVDLPNGITMTSLGKLPWDDYPGFLLSMDLGLSLMYSPHPSHLPLEMAASGVRVVTNSFGPKDLSQMSKAILSANPSARALTDAMVAAWHMPEVPPAARQVDLTMLGLSLDDMVMKFSESLSVTVR